MARGSQSQASSLVSRGSGSGGQSAPQRGSAAATAGMRRRRGSGSAAQSSSAATGPSNMLRFYTDDAPGLRITPTVVLVMSLCFIAFVTALHVIGKLYRVRSNGD